MVVVGIHETAPSNYNVVLTKKPSAGSALGDIKMLELRRTASTQLNAISSSTRSYSEYFMYYNWFHRDFTISLTMMKGDGTLSIGSTGQLDPSQNLFSGMPYDNDNAQVSVDVPALDQKSIGIGG
jgi:hypothetical protein